jgi:hypothetical protein
MVDVMTASQLPSSSQMAWVPKFPVSAVRGNIATEQASIPNEKAEEHVLMSCNLHAWWLPVEHQ